MTVQVHEVDAQRSIEVEKRDGVVYLDAGPTGACFAFDVNILLRALEREVGVKILRGAHALAMVPCRGDLGDCVR